MKVYESIENKLLLVLSFKKNENCSVILLFRCGAYEMRIEIKKPKALSLNDCWPFKVFTCTDFNETRICLSF